MIENKEIDHGKAFDWGHTSSDYAKYRDIYPPEFYKKLLDCGLCKKGQKILDLGTGTGVLPRNMFQYGADFTGIDIRETWHGRMRSCRGIGASLPDTERNRFDVEHQKLLNEIAPPRFDVLHYAAVTILQKRDPGPLSPK